MMYDELVKGLRKYSCPKYSDGCGMCPSFKFGCAIRAIQQAADAIEELSKDRDKWKATAKEERDAYRHWFDQYQKDVPRWIPAPERLPENQQFVLAWKDEKPKGFACICLWMDNAGWAFKNITQWMPLPAPPKEGDT